MSSIVSRKFSEELNFLLGRSVSIETKEGKQYSGILAAVDERMNVILEKVTGAGEGVHKLVINGDNVKEIKLMEKPFDLRGLAERLNRVFPDLVKVREDIGAIIVMDKIKVTEKGVVEGSGLAAERVKAIFDEFVRETRKS
jgi:small nuclear ribonucleoprotein (snRNP)-like protein